MTSTMADVPFNRERMLQRLTEESFDVVVIGGGITGVGVALDAVTRGLRTALVERDDFASGTSSKSSKLVHGGLRYLRQGQVRLVYQALHERQRLRHNAPHLVRMLPFMIPILTDNGVVPRKIARIMGASMWMYDLTGGWRIGKLHKRLDRDRALAHMPSMPADNVASAYLYYDATADDARLCLAVARTAAAHGAVVVNGCAVTAVHTDDPGQAHTVDVECDGHRLSIRTARIVNATGVWVDEIDRLANDRHPASVRPAKGVHLTVPWGMIRNDVAVVIPAADGRTLFVVPWGRTADGGYQHTYVGTTDTDYHGDIDQPRCTRMDIDYVLAALNASLTTAVTIDDVTGVWAGLRPLITSADSARTADLSRRHRVRANAAGVISVTGGKLTTYREMAEDTVDATMRSLGRRQRCRTKRLRLIGADGFVEPTVGSPDEHLVTRYGAEASALLAMIAADPALGEQLTPRLPYLCVEAVHAARSEMARNVDDVLTRRTRARLFDHDAACDAADRVAALIGPELGWDAARQAAEAEAFRRSCAEDSIASLTMEASA